MKQCPDCSTKNQRTNIFCPSCGHSFLDDPPPEKEKWQRVRRVVPGQDNRRLSLIVAIVIIIVLGLGAGLTSYFVSREIDRSSLVPVKSGIKWKCEKCGRVYKDRVGTVSVKKSTKADYGVETVIGVCDTCKYGKVAGFYQDALEQLAEKGYFHGFGIDIADQAAAYIAAHPELFPTPASEMGKLAQIAPEADPRTVEKEFDSWAGKPVTIIGEVEDLRVVKVAPDRSVTYLQIKPYARGEEPVDLEVIAIYDSTASSEPPSTSQGYEPLSKGQKVVCFLLPADLVSYRAPHGDRKALLGIALAVARVEVEENAAP